MKKQRTISAKMTEQDRDYTTQLELFLLSISMKVYFRDNLENDVVFKCSLLSDVSKAKGGGGNIIGTLDDGTKVIEQMFTKRDGKLKKSRK